MSETNGNGRRSVSIPITALISLISVIVGGGAGGFIAPVREDSRTWERDRRANEQEVKMERVLTEMAYMRADIDRLRQQVDTYIAAHERVR